MKWTAILAIALAQIFFGCAEDKPTPETTTLAQTQEVVETAPASEPAQEPETPVAAEPEAQSDENEPVEPATEHAKKADDANYVVYYMTSNVRCASCHKIENWTKEAVNKYFADEEKNDKMKFEMINIEEPEHEHYIDHYDLFTKSVVVSKIVGGKETAWKNLEKVWSLLNNQDTFMAYIRDEIAAFKSRAEN